VIQRVSWRPRIAVRRLLRRGLRRAGRPPRLHVTPLPAYPGDRRPRLEPTPTPSHSPRRTIAVRQPRAQSSTSVSTASTFVASSVSCALRYQSNSRRSWSETSRGLIALGIAPQVPEERDALLLGELQRRGLSHARDDSTGGKAWRPRPDDEVRRPLAAGRPPGSAFEGDGRCAPVIRATQLSLRVRSGAAPPPQWTGRSTRSVVCSGRSGPPAVSLWADGACWTARVSAAFPTWRTRDSGGVLTCSETRGRQPRSAVENEHWAVRLRLLLSGGGGSAYPAACARARCRPTRAAELHRRDVLGAASAGQRKARRAPNARPGRVWP
jgi:hypothetical protein